MDAHVVHSRNEGEDHPEKMSVRQKMKAKARKFKDTISGYGQHGHEQDVDEEDEETVIRSSPIHDSGVGKTDAPVQGEMYKTPVVSFGDTKAGRDEFDSVVPKESSNVNVTEPMKPSVPAELREAPGHGATHNSGATRTDAPAEGWIPFGETQHEYDSVVPKEKTNVGLSDLVTEQNRSSTEDNLLLKLAGQTTEPVLKHGEEKPKGFGGGTHAPHNTPKSSLPDYSTTTMDVDPVKAYGSEQGGHLGESRLGKTDVLGEDTPLPQSTAASSLVHGAQESSMDVDPKQKLVYGQGGHSDQSSVNLGEDPISPQANPEAYTPSNYESKVTDTTKSGGEDTEVTPVIRSFDKMNLQGDDGQHLNNDAKQNISTGSHDQFSPDEPSNQNLDTGAKQNISTESHDQLSPDKPSNQGTSYISSATSAIAGTAVSAKNGAASRLGYGGTESADPQDDYSGAGKSGLSPRENQNRVLDPSTNEFTPSETPQVRGTIQPDHNSETEVKSPGGSYISSATSAITSAKNAIATRLGYGASDQVHDSGDVTPTSAKPMGKVTESEEVKQRLGNTDGNDNFVVNKIEESVGSMLGGTNKKQGLSSSASTGENRRAEATGI